MARARVATVPILKHARATAAMATPVAMAVGTLRPAPPAEVSAGGGRRPPLRLRAPGMAAGDSGSVDSRRGDELIDETP